MLTFGFFLAFSLMLCSGEASAAGELNAAFLSGEQVTVDVVCAWGRESHEKQVLTDGNHKVVKITGNKVSYNCKGGVKVDALGIPDDKHDELDFACIKQYYKPSMYDKWPRAQPALNEDGAPFLSKSTLSKRFEQICEITGNSVGCSIAPFYPPENLPERYREPFLSAYYTSGGVKLGSLPQDC